MYINVNQQAGDAGLLAASYTVGFYLNIKLLYNGIWLGNIKNIC